MSLVGNKKIDKIFVGNLQVSDVYVGNTKVYSSVQSFVASAGTVDSTRSFLPALPYTFVSGSNITFTPQYNGDATSGKYHIFDYIKVGTTRHGSDLYTNTLVSLNSEGPFTLQNVTSNIYLDYVYANGKIPSNTLIVDSLAVSSQATVSATPYDFITQLQISCSASSCQDLPANTLCKPTIRIGVGTSPSGANYSPSLRFGGSEVLAATVSSRCEVYAKFDSDGITIRVKSLSYSNITVSVALITLQVTGNQF